MNITIDFEDQCLPPELHVFQLDKVLMTLQPGSFKSIKKIQFMR